MKGKLSRTVLRGASGRKATRLPGVIWCQMSTSLMELIYYHVLRCYAFAGSGPLMNSPVVSGVEPTFYNSPVGHTSMVPSKSLKIKDDAIQTLYNLHIL